VFLFFIADGIIVPESPITPMSKGKVSNTGSGKSVVQESPELEKPGKIVSSAVHLFSLF
jgi:hypothetical protein